MANSNDSIITGKLRGGLGKELVFRNWDGTTVVAKAPGARKKGPLNEVQAAIQENFLIASRYAKSVVDDPDMKAGYDAVLKPRQTAYNRALKDFMTPPTVKSINIQKYKGVIGDVISVRAVDDFRVVELRVEIRDANGVLLEEGVAIAQKSGVNWDYTSTVANAVLAGTKVTAIAVDVPGNEGSLDLVL